MSTLVLKICVKLWGVYKYNYNLADCDIQCQMDKQLEVGPLETGQEEQRATEAFDQGLDVGPIQAQGTFKSPEPPEQNKTPQSDRNEQGLIESNSISNNHPSSNPQPYAAFQGSKQQVKPGQLTTQLQRITKFDPSSKSPSILLQSSAAHARQALPYYQNQKLVLTEPITSLHATCTFRVENLHYCVGFGVALKEVVARHEYTYQSEGSSELCHGLYIVTSQGYSWSHSEKQEDDVRRQGFDQLYSGATVEVRASGEELEFRGRKIGFQMRLPEGVRAKYTLCFCAYLHEKEDAVSIAD